jgi:CBS-domain-containing membrane protein
MRGTTRGSPPRVSTSEIAWSWIGGFLGITAVAWFNHLVFEGTDLSMMIGSYGASAVLAYGAVRSPLAQPRNLVGGHVVSAIVGVICWKLLHPPGGATALIAVIGSAKIHQMGFWYVLVPATIGPLILLAVAVVVNNIPKSRRYPEIWF